MLLSDVPSLNGTPRAASEQDDQGLAELIQQIDLFCYMIPPACYPVPLVHATQAILHACRGIA